MRFSPRRHNVASDWRPFPSCELYETSTSGGNPAPKSPRKLSVMKIGTKSVLFGAHQFLIHPWFVAWAWWKLFGFPFDPRLWVAFFVHDLGYWGKPNMDGPEGEIHPRFGARLMTMLFDGKPKEGWVCGYDPYTQDDFLIGPWGQFCFYHSRFLAKNNDMPCSRLCIADKLAIALEPWWLYLPRVIATGEIKEYMRLSGTMNGESNAKYSSMHLTVASARDWHRAMVTYLCRWVNEHKDGRADTWTPSKREAVDNNGVWR